MSLSLTVSIRENAMSSEVISYPQAPTYVATKLVFVDSYADYKTAFFAMKKLLAADHSRKLKIVGRSLMERVVA